MPMTALGAVVFAACLAALVLPGSALAGEYTIHNCPGSLAPNNDAGAWRSYSTAALPSAGGYQGSCTPGGDLGAAIGWFAIEQSFNTSIGAELQTPSSDISIVSLRLVWAGAAKSSGSDTFGQINADTGAVFAEKAPFGASANAPTVVEFPDGTHTIYVDSFCSTDGSTNCYFSANTTPVIELVGMDTTLEDLTPPSATLTGGSLTGNGPISGVGTLDFTATDPDSGVEQSELLLDGSPVLTDSYASQCPYTSFAACPPSMPDSMAWNTGAVTDGEHQIALRITDAAGNTQVVGDHSVLISNPTLTPVPRRRGEVKARFVIHWTWRDARTRLVSIRGVDLPRGARIAVGCRGRGCPRVGGSVGGAGLRKTLQRRVFRAGERLYLTISAPGLSSERIEIRIRDRKKPLARLL